MNNLKQASFFPAPKESEVSVQVARKESAVKKYIYGALMSVLASGPMSGCASIPETEVAQMTTSEEEDNQREREYEIYERQMEEEVQARITRAREENPTLTDNELQKLEMQFTEEIRISATNRRIETRLALLKRSWVNTELKELANLTEERMAEVMAHVGTNGDLRLTAPRVTEYDMILKDDELSSASLNDELILALQTSGEVQMLIGDYHGWALSKGVYDDIPTRSIMDNLADLKNQWKTYTDNDPRMQAFRNLTPSTNARTTPEASPEQR